MAKRNSESDVQSKIEDIQYIEPVNPVLYALRTIKELTQTTNRLAAGGIPNVEYWKTHIFDIREEVKCLLERHKLPKSPRISTRIFNTPEKKIIEFLQKMKATIDMEIANCTRDSDVSSVSGVSRLNSVINPEANLYWACAMCSALYTTLENEILKNKG